MGMPDCAPALKQNDGVIAMYMVEDRVCVDDFIKEFSHSMYFNQAECKAMCSCKLFEMQGILCRYILVIFKATRVRSLPSKYILN